MIHGADIHSAAVGSVLVPVPLQLPAACEFEFCLGYFAVHPLPKKYAKLGKRKLSGVFVNGPSVSQVGCDHTGFLRGGTGQRSAFGACFRDTEPYSGQTLKIKMWVRLECLLPDVWRFFLSCCVVSRRI